MKKLFLLAALALISCANLMAKKQVVYVEEFSYREDIGEALTEQIRGALISSLIKYQHIQITDVASESSLSREDKRRTDNARLADDENTRRLKMRELGANYIIQGYVSNLTYTSQTNDKGKTKYNAVLSYSLKVINCEDGTLVSTDLFNHEEKKESSENKCLTKILNILPKDVKKVVTKDFKLHSTILDSDYESKNGKLLKCHINIGEDDGVVPGTVFSVKKAIIKAGRVSWTEIGEIVVESIIAGDLSLCKVKKGGDDIYMALEEIISIKESDPNNAHDLIVESKSFK
ncbi:MAG: hypothetical protein IJ834_05460 [Paludibacteraceae bacterium]|nr:hypothetical protein [Paludibacteraceae bacterium]